MTTNKTIRTALIWLPSVVVTIFFLQNAIDKVVNSNPPGKLVSNTYIVILTGAVLLFALALFLYKKTIILGTVILSTYMTFVVFVHVSKGKPFFLTILIVLLTIFAGYIRKAGLKSAK
jgi:hypothetical protein